LLPAVAPAVIDVGEVLCRALSDGLSGQPIKLVIAVGCALTENCIDRRGQANAIPNIRESIYLSATGAIGGRAAVAYPSAVQAPQRVVAEDAGKPVAQAVADRTIGAVVRAGDNVGGICGVVERTGQGLNLIGQ